MKPFSITAPEEIAKEYGGDKRKIQQAAAQGIIDPTSAVLAGMFIDRIRGAAQAEQANQPTVAEQVMAPQPQPQQQIPSAGLAASPQAAQMQQPMAPRMGQPAMGRMPQPAPAQMPPTKQPPMQQPMGMAMGGGLDSIDFVEGSYAPGGVVSFQAGGGYGETMAQLRNQLGAARTQAQRDQIQSAMNQLRAQYEQPSLQPNLSTGPAREGLAAVDTSDPMAIGMETFADNTPAQSQRIDPNRFSTGTLTEAEARRIEGGLGATPEARDFGVDAVPLTAAQQEMQDNIMRMSERRRDAGFFGIPEAFSRLDSYLREEEYTPPEKMPTYEEVRARSESSKQVPSSEEDRRGSVAEQIARMREGDAQVPSSEEDRRGSVAEQIARMQGDTADQIAEQQTTTAPETKPEDDVLARAAAMSDAENQQMTGERPMSITEQFNVFQKELSGLMPKPEYGQYRKKLEGMIDDFDETKKQAKKDGFNMALLQAGLGMLAQGGGQTALQALGKAALPATKQYASAMKDLKKEERELFKLGLSLEQMDAKERAEANRTLVNLFGRKMAGEYQIKAANITAAKKGVDAQLLEELGTEGYKQFKIDQARAGATVTAQSRAAVKGQDTEDDIRADVADYRAALKKDQVIRNQAIVAGVPLDEYVDGMVESYEADRRGTSGAASTQGIPLPANPTPATLQVGTVYKTGMGPARYTGKPGKEAFELVQ